MSVKVFARYSRAGNGCANFMGAWYFGALSARKNSMPIKFLILGFSVFCSFFLWKGGGGSANLNFTGTGIYLN